MACIRSTNLVSAKRWAWDMSSTVDQPQPTMSSTAAAMAPGVGLVEEDARHAVDDGVEVAPGVEHRHRLGEAGRFQRGQPVVLVRGTHHAGAVGVEPAQPGVVHPPEQPGVGSEQRLEPVPIGFPTDRNRTRRSP